MEPWRIQDSLTPMSRLLVQALRASFLTGVASFCCSAIIQPAQPSSFMWCGRGQKLQGLLRPNSSDHSDRCCVLLGSVGQSSHRAQALEREESRFHPQMGRVRRDVQKAKQRGRDSCNFSGNNPTIPSYPQPPLLSFFVLKAKVATAASILF